MAAWFMEKPFVSMALILVPLIIGGVIGYYRAVRDLRIRPGHLTVHKSFPLPHGWAIDVVSNPALSVEKQAYIRNGSVTLVSMSLNELTQFFQAVQQCIWFMEPE